MWHTENLLLWHVAILAFAPEAEVWSLGAPVALASRAAGRVWAVAAWCFHVGVLALMAISFPYQLSGIVYASFFPVERIAPARDNVTPAHAEGFGSASQMPMTHAEGFSADPTVWRCP